MRARWLLLLVAGSSAAVVDGLGEEAAAAAAEPREWLVMVMVIWCVGLDDSLPPKADESCVSSLLSLPLVGRCTRYEGALRDCQRAFLCAVRLCVCVWGVRARARACVSGRGGGAQVSIHYYQKRLARQRGACPHPFSHCVLYCFGVIIVITCFFTLTSLPLC